MNGMLLMPIECVTHSYTHTFMSSADLSDLVEQKDMHGRDIDNARILVDMERERSMKGWVPRRFGNHVSHCRIITS